jgi:hypothetical protein
MSDYQDYILSGDTRILFPLEEATTDPIVNLGNIGTAVTGTHTDTIEHQFSLVYQEQFSMRYLTAGLSNATVNGPVNTEIIRLWIIPDFLTESILKLTLSTDPSQELHLFIEDGYLSLEINGVRYSLSDSINPVTLMQPGTKYYVVIDGTDQPQTSFFINGNDEYGINFNLTTFNFDTIQISTDSPLCFVNLVDEFGNNLVDEFGNNLIGLCADNVACLLEDEFGNLLLDQFSNNLDVPCN